MPANENKKADKDATKANLPLSETIENAHASGDGSLERDKDTILNPREEQKEGDADRTPTSNEAY